MAKQAALTRRVTEEPLCIATKCVTFHASSLSVELPKIVWFTELSSNSSDSDTILNMLKESSSDWWTGENSPSAYIGN